jgi:hypothetical protein
LRQRGELTLRAKNGPEHAQQSAFTTRIYSITSSARASTAGGIEAFGIRSLIPEKQIIECGEQAAVTCCSSGSSQRPN